MQKRQAERNLVAIRNAAPSCGAVGRSYAGPGLGTGKCEPYRLYRKIANATKAAVIIQRMMLLLLLLFSSAIAESTAYLLIRFKSRLDFPGDKGQGFAAV